MVWMIRGPATTQAKYLHGPTHFMKGAVAPPGLTNTSV